MKHLSKSCLGILAAVAFATAPLVPLCAQTPVNPPAHITTITHPVQPATTASPAEDIHDIRGLKPIPSSTEALLWLAGGAALAGLAYGAWRWFRHVRMTAKLPYELALDRLEKARALMKVETAREFSIEVSEIVRSYIEVRFKVRASHQTTEEFLHQLLEPSDALLASHQQLLADFLHHCDLAKFARWVLSPEEMEEMHASARTFVLETGKATAPVKADAAPTTLQPAQA